MQRCDVAVADKNFCVGADNAVVEQGQQARGAVAATHTKDAMNAAVGEHSHHVAGALAVAAGQIAVALADVGREFDFEAELLQGRQPNDQWSAGSGGALAGAITPSVSPGERCWGRISMRLKITPQPRTANLEHQSAKTETRNFLGQICGLMMPGSLSRRMSNWTFVWVKTTCSS